MLNHESQLVMVWVLESELNVSAPEHFQFREGINFVGQQFVALHHQLGERILADVKKQVGLVNEMEIHSRRRVVYFLGDPPHGDIFVAFLREQIPGRAEDLPLQGCFGT
jgi:hypothetical protein